MPKLNTQIVMSIIADIKELVKVGNEIYSWIGDIEHQSWKFPTKNGRNINVLEIVELHKGSAGEMYILLLELAYDRINFVLRLIVEFMDMYPCAKDYPKEMKNVKRPKYMSIAAEIGLIWDRLKLFPGYVSKKKAKMKDLDYESFTEKISRGTQAVSGCFKDCRSCSFASATILDTIKEIESTFLENKLISAAAKEREVSKFSLWDKSQWAVMSKLAEAINQDVRIILKLARDNARISESVKKDHDNKLKRLQVEMKSRISALDILKIKNSKLEERIRNVETEIVEARNNQQDSEQRTRNLITELQGAKGKISVSEECNQIIQNQLIQVIDTKNSLEKTVEVLKLELKSTNEKYLEIDKLKDVITKLQNENVHVKREFECKIAKLEEEVVRKSLTNRNNQNCRCTASVEKLTKTNSSSYSRDKSVVKPEDNPEADMAQQLNLNQQKIKELERQNERLSKTLDRLREHRFREYGEKVTTDIQ